MLLRKLGTPAALVGLLLVLLHMDVVQCASLPSEQLESTSFLEQDADILYGKIGLELTDSLPLAVTNALMPEQQYNLLTRGVERNHKGGSELSHPEREYLQTVQRVLTSNSPKTVVVLDEENPNFDIAPSFPQAAKLLLDKHMNGPDHTSVEDRVREMLQNQPGGEKVLYFAAAGCGGRDGQQALFVAMSVAEQLKARIDKDR